MSLDDLLKEVERLRERDHAAEMQEVEEEIEAKERQKREKISDRRRLKKLEKTRPKREAQQALHEHRRMVARRLNRLVRYGISEEEFCQRMNAQNHACAICGTCLAEEDVCIDHCHATGIVRDLLCGLCNSGLGFARDDPEILRSMALYVERHAAVEHPVFMPDPDTANARRRR